MASFSNLRPRIPAMNALPSLSLRSVSTPAFFHWARIDWTTSENAGPKLAVLSAGNLRPQVSPMRALGEGRQRALLGIVEVQEAVEARDLHHLLDRGVCPADLEGSAVDLGQLGCDKDRAKPRATDVLQL